MDKIHRTISLLSGPWVMIILSLKSRIKLLVYLYDGMLAARGVELLCNMPMLVWPESSLWTGRIKSQVLEISVHELKQKIRLVLKWLIKKVKGSVKWLFLWESWISAPMTFQPLLRHFTPMFWLTDPTEPLVSRSHIYLHRELHPLTFWYRKCSSLLVFL